MNNYSCSRCGRGLIVPITGGLCLQCLNSLTKPSQELVLHLNVHRKWFDMIALGEKPEEYRLLKEYYITRLLSSYEIDTKTNRIKNPVFKPFTKVIFKNGYSRKARVMEKKIESIKIGYGKRKWGAEKGKQYFIIKLKD